MNKYVIAIEKVVDGVKTYDFVSDNIEKWVKDNKKVIKNKRGKMLKSVKKSIKKRLKKKGLKSVKKSIKKRLKKKGLKLEFKNMKNEPYMNIISVDNVFNNVKEIVLPILLKEGYKNNGIMIKKLDNEIVVDFEKQEEQDIKRVKKNIKKGRKSPQESAKEYEVNFEKKGEDGNMWLVKEDKNGRKRWVKKSSKKKRKEMLK